VVILSNLGTVSPDNLALSIANLYLADVMQTLPATPQAKKHQEIAVDPAIYNDYTGRYQMQPGFIITFTNENNCLMSQGTGQSKFELYPEGKDTFFAKIADIQIIFVRNQEGKVSSMRVLQAGYDLTANKLPELVLTPTQLTEYCGEYYSGELATTYQISLKENRLLAQHLRFGEIPLELTGLDCFTYQGITLAFKRNKNNRITGFLVSSGRVKNLRFTKVN
jgi:hypothetical protein